MSHSALPPDNHQLETSATVLPTPQLKWLDGDLPASAEFEDPYFSLKSGLDESRYVFLQHNDLPQRWHHFNWQQQPTFCITETGFGTGLNFLVTWQAWREFKTTQPNAENAWLHFSSIEKLPLSHPQLKRALDLWPELSELTEKLLAHYPEGIRGEHHFSWPEERISLTLWFDDVHAALPLMSGPVHAWYLDGFSPAKNPQMWTPELFEQVRRISQLHPSQYNGDFPASVATFTAASAIRRGLIGAGFAVQRSHGFGEKREMLSGLFMRTMGPERPAHYWQRPWTVREQQNQGQCIVIGAGLAGTTTARALAERGYSVLVIDKSGIAQHASGNPQGGLYIKVAASDDAMHTDFYVSAYQYALTFMQRYLGVGDSSNKRWQQCGVLQLAYDEKEQARQQKFIEHYPLPHSFIHSVDIEQASAIAGIEQRFGGLYFPKAGWVSPADLCRALLDHPNIQFQQDSIHAFSPHEQGWLLQGSQSYAAQHVIIATAFEAKTLVDAYLPIKNIRGQLSILNAAKTPPLKTVLCGQSYMAPANNGTMCLGATYNLRDIDTNVRAEDHQINLNNLVDFGTPWQHAREQLDTDLIAAGRVGFRCTTPDYLPMAGAIPYTETFAKTYAQLAKNSNQIPPIKTQQYPGLWLNIGHGSRGLVSAPLCAEIIAAQIANDALPINKKMAEALWPGRFLLRDVIRRKISASS